MECLHLMFIMIVVIRETSELNPDILKYDEWIKDAETTVKKIKSDEKRREQNQMDTGAYIPNKRETDSVIYVGKNHSVKSVLMVCTGNYASSPIVEAVFEELTKEKGVDSEWRCDSAGLDLYDDKTMNEQAQAKLKEHGIQPGNHTCRLVTEEDLNAYDYVLAMTRENLRDLRSIAPVGFTAKLELLSSYDPQDTKLIRHPDIWAPAFLYEEIYQIANRSCNVFLDKHSSKH